MEEDKNFVIAYRKNGYIEILSYHGNFASARKELKHVMNVVAKPEKKHYFISNKSYGRKDLKKIN